MAQPRPNEMPKIIALLAGIFVVLFFAGYQLFGVSRTAQNPTVASGVPAITTATSNPPTSGTSATGTAANIAAANPTIVSAKPGQMRQFDPTLDADPDGTYPPVNPGARFNTFEKYKPPSEQPRATVKPPIVVNTGNTSPGLKNWNDGGVTRPPELTVRPVVDNTPQQEITLDGVVTGNDGFAVLTIREPSRQNTAIPDQKRFVRLGEMVGNAKIVEITEFGLKLDKSEGIWSVGDKRGVTRRGIVLAFAPPSERAPAPAMDAKLPMISTP